MAALWALTPVFAQADDDKAAKQRRAKAEKLRAEGYKLAGKNKYKQAFKTLEAVLPLEPHTDPALLIDLAALAEGLKNCHKAILFYQGYLYTMPDEKEMRQIQAKRDACLKQITSGTLDFDSKPKGVEVRLNHVVVGRAPFGGLRLPTGSYKVQASRAHHHPYQNTVGVEQNLTQRVRIVMEKKVYKGNIRVEVEPKEGSTIYLNHVKVGASPFQRKGLETRLYLIHIENKAWDRWVRYVRVEKDQTTTVRVTLEKTGTDVPVPPLPQN